MRDDEARTCATLEALRDALKSCPVAHEDRWTGYLIRLGTYVRDNPLARGALEEIRQDGINDEESIRERSGQLTDRGMALTTLLGDILKRFPGEAKAELYVERDLSAGVAPRAFRDLLREIERGPITLTIDKLAGVAGGFVELLRPHIGRFAAEEASVAEFLSQAAELQSAGAAASHLCEAKALMRTATVHRAGDRLIALADAWTQRLKNPGAARRLDIDGLKDDAPFLVDMVVVQVQEGVTRRYAIHRLRVLFENFIRDKLRDELRAEEAGPGIARREQLLQTHMDEFLFREGYFPITHTKASAGFMDTLLLDRAVASRIPPLLIELKQAVNVTEPAKIKAADVREEIAAARGEVARYLNQVSSRPAWQRTTPIVVVVHTCREDLSALDTHDTILIDLCDRTPSKKTPAVVTGP